MSLRQFSMVLFAAAAVLFSSVAFAADDTSTPGVVGDRGRSADEPADPAEDESGREEFGWSPALSFGFGAYTQSLGGDTSTTDTDFPQETGDSYISVALSLEGKLYTPLQLDVPSKPRLFLSGGVHIPLAEELIAERIDAELINRYAPGINQLTNPDDSAFVQAEFAALCADTSPQAGNPTVNPFSRIESCGLRIRNQVTIDAMWSLGFGIEFEVPIPALDTAIRLRPAVEYYGMSIQTVGDFTRTNSGISLDDLIESANSVGDAELYHGISPSLAIAADVYESGPFRWSMYLQGRAVFFPDDPAFGSQSSLGTGAVAFATRADDLAFQMNGGIQVQWTGKR
ncbi:MAG: hypothetical protein NXI30_14655 [bacterium]|nr:hypothetical protein [bacterium]